MPMPLTRSINSPSMTLLRAGRAYSLGSTPLSETFLASIASIASSMSLPMVGCLARACRCDHRASFGTQNTFSAMYSSGSSTSARSSLRSAARFASKASELYLRKIRPRATCL